jgi:glycosyltransferase involved in cell wall biosynthesis
VTSRTPVVSIITPCHNGMPFLASMLDSVQRQTFGAWEHIVVDDGSVDGSAAEVESRLSSEPRLTLLRQQRAGVAHARNAGYAASHPGSAYLYFLDADDVLHPEMLATMTSYLDARPQVGVAYCDYECIDEECRAVEKVIQPRYVPGFLGPRVLDPDEPRTPVASVYSWAPVMESVSLVRRTAFAAAGGWDPTLGQGGEGVDLFTRIALFSEIHFVNRVLYAYRRHASQASRDYVRAGRQDLRVQIKWRDRRDLTPRERTIIDAAQAFRAGQLRIHHSLRAACQYVTRGEIRHAVHCCADVCLTMARRAVRQSPWPADGQV